LHEASFGFKVSNMTYTAEEFRNGAPPRIMGSETEYTTDAVPFDRGLQRYIDGIETYRCESRDDGADLWLENGARLYLDSGGTLGTMLEYATPECIGATEVATHEIAGERIVQAYAEKAAVAMSNPGYDVTDKVYKRSGYADIRHAEVRVFEPLTSGHHENYATPINGAARYNALRIGSYLCSRAVWAGAGLVTMNGYELSQKTAAMDFHSNTKTAAYGRKPAFMIDSSEDPPRRLEIRVGDGNMIPSSIRRKYAVTSFVLRMIEHGAFPTGLTITESDQNESFVRTAQALPIRVRNKAMSAANHQLAILRSGLDYFDTRNDVALPDEELQAVYETIEICRFIAKLRDLRDSAAIAQDVDWAAKLDLMMRLGITEPTGADLNAVMVDLRYEDISEKGLSPQRKLLANSTSGTTDLAIANARILPPATRAERRVAGLQSLDGNPTVINWYTVTYAGKVLSMRDPYVVA
jgi:proteasome accessory factor A